VYAWLVTEPKTFFSDDILKLVDRWTMFAEKDWDYKEK
jgi:hypothetical protein